MVVPASVETVFREFRTCEMTTLSRDGSPITWPVLPLYLPDRGCFLVTTSVGFPQKALNALRNPRVAMLFSDPTGSNLESPPTVLVQGDATVRDEICTWNGDLAEFYHLVYRRQPRARLLASPWLLSRFWDWYYMRFLIYVTPRRIVWWQSDDFLEPPLEEVVGRAG